MLVVILHTMTPLDNKIFMLLKRELGLWIKRHNIITEKITIQTHGFHTYIHCDKVIEIWLWMWHSNTNSWCYLFDIFPYYSSSQPHISWQYGDMFFMDSAKVGVLQEAYQICLDGLMQCQHHPSLDMMVPMFSL